uniref:Uncharacterized protein n=1 Tax=Oryza meridionalis TaxID=40149 RepID=A0A0E0DPG8_9ORYZ
MWSSSERQATTRACKEVHPVVVAQTGPRGAPPTACAKPRYPSSAGCYTFLRSSPSPSPVSLRQWRPPAQRNLRNQWLRLLAAKAQCLYMPGMDLGVLKDMPGIREKASGNLARRARREEQCQSMLVSAYREMVLATAELVKASHSMRCFSKVDANSPLIWFTERQDDMNGSGDGGGSPVFKWLSVIEFENLAQELANMFISALQLKRLLVLELLSVTFKEGVQHDASLEWSDELFNVEFNEFQSIGLVSGDSYTLAKNWIVDVSQSWQPSQTPSHEVLQAHVDVSYMYRVIIRPEIEIRQRSIHELITSMSYKYAPGIKSQMTNLVVCVKVLINIVNTSSVSQCKSF